MAKQVDLMSLVKQFATEIEAAVSARVNAEFAARFEDFRSRIIDGAVGVKKSMPSLPAAGVAKKRGPKAGGKAELKPCPVCGEKNKARRFSYLCEKHRSDENLKKFKGAAKPTAAAKAGGRKGGRRKGSKKGAPAPSAS